MRGKLHYKEASIFLLTSDLEGFGLVVIERHSGYGGISARHEIGGCRWN